MRPALVATSHGTADPGGQAAVAALVDAVRRRLPDVDVRDAFVDVQQPDLDAVIADVAGPATVVPLLVSPGFHVRVDVARATMTPGVGAAPTLGPDPRLTAVLVRRLLSVGADDADTIVLGSAGSSDPVALECFERIARDLSTAIGQIVPVGYVGGSGRPLADVVRAARTGDRRVVVSSLLMAPGHFHRRLLDVDADVVTRPLLDADVPDARLVELVCARYAQAQHSLAPAVAHP